jgi:glycosyltransferase involved in cell wall biosynthesis
MGMIIVCFDEKNIIFNKSLNEIKEFFKSAKKDYNIIYIDNYNSDQCLEYVNTKINDFPKLKIIKLNYKFNLNNLKKVSNIFDSNSFQFIKKNNSIRKKPLISILIYNYNYGLYLRDCFDSVLNQSYKNFEIIFSDNASIDDSWNIAVEYAKKYPNKIKLVRNDKNYGPLKNLINCYNLMEGDFRIELCSDDFLLKDCLKNCITNFLLYPDTAFIMYNRVKLNENNIYIDEKPFYSKSVYIPAKEQSLIYMVASINPSISQICYNNRISNNINNVFQGNDPILRWYGSRVSDFKLNFEHPIIYLNKPFLVNRIGHNRDSSFAKINFLEILGPYILNLYFLQYSNYESKFVEKFNQSLIKISNLSLRYAAEFIILKNIKAARSYYNFSKAFDENIINTEEFKFIDDFFNKKISHKKFIEKSKSKFNFLERSISYPPPDNSIIIS